MKAILLAFAFLVLPTYATSLGLLTVKMPVFLPHSEMDQIIEIMDIPVTNASDTNEAKYGGICHEFVPPNLSSWVKPTNINVAYAYGICITTAEAQEKDIYHRIITIDASAAKRPEGYPFSIEQVTDSVMTCVKLMTPATPESEKNTTIKVLPVKK
jgi:hypothetical protein